MRLPNGARRVLELFLLASPGLVACAVASAPRAPLADSVDESARPNFVVFLVDDLRFDMLGFAGHPFVETPHIDRLAREGTQFTNAFVTTSLCCPSRASLLTGLYAHQHGVTTNLGIELGPEHTTFPMLLSGAGWDTAFVGKWHMGDGADPRPGFDHWVSFDGQGRYFDPVINENGDETEVEGYVTDLLTDRALAWLDARRDAGDADPFCLFVSHKATHTPMAPAARHRGRYASASIAAPPSAGDDLAGKPEILRRAASFGWETADIEAHANDPVPESVPAPAWDIRSYVQAYLETTLSVDDSVGRLIAKLEEQGVMNDTVFLFASDNGYTFGEHQAPDKRLAWEESIHVPFIVYAPGRVDAGAVLDDIVLNIDVAPSLLDWAGIDGAESMAGRSFVPVLAGNAPDWRDHFFYSYFREHNLLGIPTTLAVRTKEWKYVRYPESLEPNEELYRVDRDPFELTNLAAEPDARETLDELRAMLAGSMQETAYAVPEHARPPSFTPIENAAPVTIALDGDEPLRLPAKLLAGRAFTFGLELAASDGLVLQAGRPRNGLTLSVEDGRPVLEIVARARTRRVVGPPLDASAPTTRVDAGLDLTGRAFVRVGSEELRSPLSMPALTATGNALVVGTNQPELHGVDWTVVGE